MTSDSGAGISVDRLGVLEPRDRLLRDLLVGNVPEGLLPVITLALAVAVGLLARRVALVKRLSAVETLGCTDVICTVLTQAGWQPGDPTGSGSPFHHAYLQATTMTFLGMIFGQIGTAFAVRTQRAPLRSVGVFSNRYLLLAIAAELAVAAVLVYAPPLQSLLGTAALPARYLLLLLPYPLIVWGADELRKYLLRRAQPAAPGGIVPGPENIPT